VEYGQSAGDATGPGYAELNRAMTELEQAAALLPDDVSGPDALTMLDDELDAVVTAARALSAELGCVDQLGL